MANILALEWDSHEARIVAARRRGNEVFIEHAFSVDLQPGGADEPLDFTEVGERIAAGLSERRIGRCDALAAVGRSGIELRLLTVPPTPDEELPELVRFQAQRQFTTLGDDWPLDFFPIDGQADDSRNVLAASIQPELVGQIQQGCDAAHLRLQRIVLRPCAAASLLLRQHHGRDSHRVRLLVDILAEEADLTVTVDQTVVFTRTVRLAGEWNSPSQVQALFGEVRRTLAAAQNQLGGQLVEHVLLFGPDVDHSVLRSQIEERLQLPVSGFDPFEGLTTSRELGSNPPEHPGRFAPLLGMLVDECTGAPHAIDFLHPRQKPQPASRTGQYALAGAAVAALVLVAVGYLWLQLRGMDATIRGHNERLAELNQITEDSKQRRDVAATIDKWVAGDITWLDELARLSARLPPAENVRLSGLHLDAVDSGGGRMRLEGYVDQQGTISDIEQDLRDEQHHVYGDGGRLERGDRNYPWRFETLVDIDPPDLDQITQPRPESPSTETNDGPAEADEEEKAP